MSPNERSAWVRLTSLLIVFIPYFVYVWGLFKSGGDFAQSICVAFMIAAIAHGTLNGIAQGVMGSVLGCVMRDERDRKIDALSLRVAYYTLLVLVLSALSTIAAVGFLTPPAEIMRFREPNFSVTSQYVFLCIVAAEALRHLTQVYWYRKEAA
jgi:hypothetical protein